MAGSRWSVSPGLDWRAIRPGAPVPCIERSHGRPSRGRAGSGRPVGMLGAHATRLRHSSVTAVRNGRMSGSGVGLDAPATGSIRGSGSTPAAVARVAHAADGVYNVSEWSTDYTARGSRSTRQWTESAGCMSESVARKSGSAIGVNESLGARSEFASAAYRSGVILQEICTAVNQKSPSLSPGEKLSSAWPCGAHTASRTASAIQLTRSRPHRRATATPIYRRATSR
jgi:hypothetical protein